MPNPHSRKRSLVSAGATSAETGVSEWATVTCGPVVCGATSEPSEQVIFLRWNNEADRRATTWCAGNGPIGIVNWSRPHGAAIPTSVHFCIEGALVLVLIAILMRHRRIIKVERVGVSDAITSACLDLLHYDGLPPELSQCQYLSAEDSTIDDTHDNNEGQNSHWSKGHMLRDTEAHVSSHADLNAKCSECIERRPSDDGSTRSVVSGKSPRCSVQRYNCTNEAEIPGLKNRIREIREYFAESKVSTSQASLDRLLLERNMALEEIKLFHVEREVLALERMAVSAEKADVHADRDRREIEAFHYEDHCAELFYAGLSAISVAFFIAGGFHAWNGLRNGPGKCWNSTVARIVRAGANMPLPNQSGLMNTSLGAALQLARWGGTFLALSGCIVDVVWQAMGGGIVALAGRAACSGVMSLSVGGPAGSRWRQNMSARTRKGRVSPIVSFPSVLTIGYYTGLFAVETLGGASDLWGWAWLIFISSHVVLRLGMGFLPSLNELAKLYPFAATALQLYFQLLLPLATVAAPFPAIFRR